MPDATRGCRGCGSPLAPNKRPGRRREWCSEACRVANYRNPRRPEHPCERCAAPTRNQQWCSRKCSDRGRFPRLVRPCAICGETFEGRQNQKYCSERCKWRRPRRQMDAAGLERRRERDRLRKRPSRICSVCGHSYAPTGGDQKYCSRRCGGIANRRRPWPSCKIYFPECVICSRRFTARSRPKQKLCGKECRAKYVSQYAAARIMKRYRTDPEFRDQMLSKAHARRADKLGLKSSAVLLGYLIKRDKGRCGICHRPVRAKRGPMRPSIDHKVPLSRGGDHDLKNVQLAHYRCNLSKNNQGGGEQLLLIG